MQKPLFRLVIYLWLLLTATEVFAQNERLETARRHLVRGTAAIEMAKTSSDLQDAAQEFRKATELAPEMAAAWFNLGAVESKLKRYAEAITAYQRYLQLNPEAEDVQKVQDEIIKLEYQQERVSKVATVQTLPVLNSPAKGPENAPVTLTVFSDFQCPYCTRLVPFIDEVAAQNPATVRVVFKQFPLRMHNFAEPAALASLAAHEQGKFWPMHDKLFANFSQLSDEKIRAIAQEVGLDLARFDRDRTSQKLRDEVLRDQRLGQQAGVRGTPTVFINGKLLKERTGPGAQALIDREVTQAGTAKER